MPDAPSQDPAAAGPPRLLAQMNDPRITLPDALELALYKAMLYQQYLHSVQQIDPPELQNIVNKVREAHFWLSELTTLLHLHAKEKAGLVVAQNLPPDLIQQ